jgi:hypothetical protein
MTRRKRIRHRKRKANEHRATIAPYLAELERAKVPPLVAAQAAAMFVILLGARCWRLQKIMS